jgi:cytochrome c
MKQKWKIGLLVAASVAAVFGAGATATIGNVAEALLPSKAEEGRVLFVQVCRSCHSNEPDRQKSGPSLFGVSGRTAGSAPGFDYSTAMREASVTWSDDALNRYLADTKHFIPGNAMPYSLLMGTQNQQRRRSVIAYLHTLK